MNETPNRSELACTDQLAADLATIREFGSRAAVHAIAEALRSQSGQLDHHTSHGTAALPASGGIGAQHRRAPVDATVRALAPPAPRGRARRAPSGWWWAAIVTGLVALGGLAWLVVWAVMAMVAAVTAAAVAAAPAVLIVLAVVVLVLWLLGRRGGGTFSGTFSGRMH